MQLGECSRCGGLIPQSHQACPNCKAVVTWRTAAAISALLTLEGCNVFLAQPVYGVPCVSDAGLESDVACNIRQCDDQLADGGRVGNDPAVKICPPADAGTDGGTDAGSKDGGLDGG